MTKTSAPTVQTALPKATIRDTLAVVADVLIPNLLSSSLLAGLLANRQPHPHPPARLGPSRPLSATLNNYALRFILAS
ncbi:MAG: hypothetical protein OHK0022_37820 [Roseiflexaceae bacterium]